MRKLIFCFIVIINVSIIYGQEYKVRTEITGPFDTNIHLIYDTNTKEAALIDPGWKAEETMKFIKDNHLKLKYLISTHGHWDHWFYAPEFKKQYPEAKWIIHRADYENIIKNPNWERIAYGEKWIENALKNPEMTIQVEYDRDLVPEPDIFVKDGQTFMIGSVPLTAIHTPGHSPGSTCFYTDNILFTGDVLFYHSVGILDKLTSNTEIFIESVRKLYMIFPDCTIIYPGHLQVTTIGAEKKYNKRISAVGGVYTEKIGAGSIGGTTHP